MKCVIFSIIMFLGLTPLAQKVSGYVMDKNTQLPIPYASVFFRGTTIGTATSLDGKFNLENSDSSFYRSIVIRCTGYESSIVDLNDRVRQELRIHLNESIKYLDQVIVEPLPNGIDLIKCVTNRIENKEIYSEAVDSEYFFRNLVKVDGYYSEFLESFGSWHSEGFHKEHLSETNHAYIEYFEFYKPKHLRAKISKPLPDPIFPERMKLPNIWAFCKAYYYLLPDSDKISWYDFETEDRIDYEDYSLYKVNFTLTKIGLKKAAKALELYERLPGFTLSEGTYYVNSTDCTLEQIDFNFEAYGVGYTGIVKFTKFNNEYYRHFMRLVSRYKVGSSEIECIDEVFWSNFKNLSLSDDKLLIEYGMTRRDEFDGYALLTNINSLYNQAEYPKVNQLVPGLLVYLKGYDPSYWKNRNVPDMPERYYVYKDLKIQEEDFAKFEFRNVYNQFFNQQNNKTSNGY